MEEKVEEKESREKKREFKVKDEELNEERTSRGEAKPTNFTVYGDTAVDKDEEEALNLGPKFMKHVKLDKEDAEVEAEVYLIQQRMELRKQDEMKDGNGNVNEEERKKLEEEEVENRTVLNPETKSLSLARWRTTDTKYNTRSFPPRTANKQGDEIKLQVQKSGVTDAVNKFMKEKCNEKGEVKEGNLNACQRAGVLKLQRRVARGEIVIQISDKSNKLVVMKSEDYKQAVMKHVEKDVEVPWDSIPREELSINRHTTAIRKVFCVGAAHGHEARMAQAFRAVDQQPPPLSAYPKDHKRLEEGEVIPPTRPVVSANSGPNSRASHLLSTIINRIADQADQGTECRSTEEMMRGILETNRRLGAGQQHQEHHVDGQEQEQQQGGGVEAGGPHTAQGLDGQQEGGVETRGPQPHAAPGLDGQPAQQPPRGLEVLSMDVAGMYPNLVIQEVLEVLYTMVLATSIQFEDIDYEEAGKYLAVTMTEEEKTRCGFGEVLPRRMAEVVRERRGEVGPVPGPRITMAYLDNEEVKLRNENGEEVKLPKWQSSGINPSPLQQRMMVAWTLMKGVEVVMGSHFYRFSGKAYHQQAGGPIGLELSQAVARLVMLWWDGEFLQRCQRAGVAREMYLRYLDDVNMITRCLPAGTVYQDGGLVVDRQLEEEEQGVEGDKVTARVVREVANSITNMIRMEEDVPSNHPSNKLPILDLEVWVEGNTILHQCYKKPVSSKFVVMAQSAFPDSKKRSVLLEEGVRRLRNNSPQLPAGWKAQFLTELALEMQNSGHKESFRISVLDAAVAKYNMILDKHTQGIADMYRTRAQITKHKLERGGMAERERYFRRAGAPGQQYTATLKVPPTPGAGLRDAMQRALNSHQGPQGTRGRVEEVGGQALRHLLVKSDPYPRDRCGRPTCPLGGAPEARPAPTRPSSQGSSGTRASARLQARQASQQPVIQPSQPVQQPQQPVHPLVAKQKEKGCMSRCYGDHHNYEWYCTRCDMAIIANHNHHNHEGQNHHNQDQDNQQGGPQRRPKYLGESCRSPHTRGDQHVDSYARHEDRSYMQQHTDQEHAGVVGEQDYVLVVTRRDRDPVRRVVREAVRLKEESEDTEHDMTLDPTGGVIKIKTLLMNDKINEWYGAWMMEPTMTDV